MLGPDTPGTFTPRAPSKGKLGDQIEAFVHMLGLHADFADAVIACVTGHRMTPDLAAMCIATYWRRYAAIANYQESRGAAITIQAALRGMDDRQAFRMQAEAEAEERGLLGLGPRDPGDDDDAFRYAAKLQAVWRGHLARAFADKLRWQAKTKLQRTFSWGKKGKKKPKDDKKNGKKEDGKDVFKERSAKDILASHSVDDPKLKTTIRRSMSFDRFSKGVKSIIPGKSDEKDDKPSATPKSSKQLLFILLQRGSTGLGLELDATNTVVNLVPGGAADTQGYFREGDTIASVDGIPLRGRLLQDVMDRQKSSYSFDVWRLAPVEPDPPPAKALNPVRRAFSFDRKKK